ncbi:MAG: isopentenyl-diphosphate Delta-isomerase [Chitinophagaceae bacterium]|nr:isopentenyl-diphosphate Delta-isomerase [Chitinophagaceae bacterium]
MESVILVDKDDNHTGTMEKLEAHRLGILHRAFSIFIFDDEGKMLLQQRALNKYHSGGLWTNACCSHPRPGERTADAALRRLKEELGIESRLEKIFDFIYHTPFVNGLSEHEFDHVFAGNYNGTIPFSKTEVMNARFLSLDEIEHEMLVSPEQYTAWFHIAYERVKEWKLGLAK